MRKGSIVLIPFPFTDLSGQKVRPAVVLHAARGEDCIVAFISSVVKKDTLAHVAISPDESNGLKTRSHIKMDKLATLQKAIVIGELGVLDDLTMKKLDDALRHIFTL